MPPKQINPIRIPTLNETITSVMKYGASSFLGKFHRPGFSVTKSNSSRLEASLATQEDWTKASLSDPKVDLAAPHRLPYAFFRDVVLDAEPAKVEKMVRSLCQASEHYERGFQGRGKEYEELRRFYEQTRENVLRKFGQYKSSLRGTGEERIVSKLELIKSMNDIASNAPGLGPHLTANNPVRDRLHVQPITKRSLSPRSKAALAEGKLGRNSLKLATVPSLNGNSDVISVTGAKQEFTLKGIPHEDVSGVGMRVFRGALYVDDKGRLWKPRRPFKEPSGNFLDDWEFVPKL